MSSNTFAGGCCDSFGDDKRAAAASIAPDVLEAVEPERVKWHPYVDGLRTKLERTMDRLAELQDRLAESQEEVIRLPRNQFNQAGSVTPSLMSHRSRARVGHGRPFHGPAVHHPPSASSG